MSEIEGGGGGSVESIGSGEVSSSSEVSEISVAETGGESSEATQQATTEEAGESGGFDEDTDTTESPEESTEEYEESDFDEEPDDSRDVGFSEDDDIENIDYQYDDTDYENDEMSFGDEDGVGFDDSDDNISDEIDEEADSETEFSDLPMDEDNDESVDESNDYDDDSSEADWDDQENDKDLGENEVYSDEETLDDNTEDGDNIDDVQDDDEAQTEDSDSTVDRDESDGTETDTEDSDDIDDDWDDQEDEDAGEPEDYSDEKNLDDNTEDDDNIDDVQDDGEAQIEDSDSTADGAEADGDIDNDGESDGTEIDIEVGTEDGDNIDDVQDDGEVQTEVTNSIADGDEADGDMDNDGEPDNADANDETDTEDDDYDEDEDPGELEEYSDEDTENRNEDDESTENSESERDKEEQAVEDNKEAVDRVENETENADVENVGKNIDDAAEYENKNPTENGTEQQTEPVEAKGINEVDTENDTSRIGENDNSEDQTETLDNKEDNSTDTSDQNEKQLDDTNEKMENKAETPEGEDAYRTAMSNMTDYMNEHNYGRDDYSEYSKDPEWQKLNADLQKSLDMEVTTDVSTPSLESGKDVSVTELPDNCVMLNAFDIDMTYAQGMDSDQFWNHHGNTKEDYMHMAERIPDVQQALDSGKSLDEIKQDPELKDTAYAYFDPDNMIKVEQQSNGRYSFVDDGRHRIAAAQELGYEIPVEVKNMPENANAATADNVDLKSEGTTTSENVANKSDISSETCENLGAFEQNNWDNLSQVEKEQAVKKLRDSIAEDLHLENKPNIAYYNNKDNGDYGGYAASTNTIYINRFNMGDATKTADTIAHEARHCWQHERADNPKTEQDYQFKENLENYIRPEENFEEYLNQPVEKDARDYAETVKNQIPEDTQKTDYKVDSVNNSQSDGYSESNPRAPPESEYQSKTVSELPNDFEAKRVDFEWKKITEVNYQELRKIGKNVYDNSSGPIESDANGPYRKLTEEEKSELASKAKELIDSKSKEQLGDFKVPKAEKIKGVREDGTLAEAWKPNTDGAVNGTRRMEIPTKGQIIDRIGRESGNYFSPMDENGKPYSLEARAMGDYLPKENISDNAAYHAYKIQKDFTKENFKDAINEYILNDIDKEQWLKKLDAYYDDCADVTAKDHAGDSYADSSSDADGVKTGKIAPMFKADDGGAIQYITPFNAADLKKIRMIKDV